MPLMEECRINFKRDFHHLGQRGTIEARSKLKKRGLNSWRPSSKTNRKKQYNFLEAAIERWLSFP